MYRVKNDRLPVRLEDLVPNEIRTIRLDPWGNPYDYGYRVRSAGPDGALGTDDDLTSDR